MRASAALRRRFPNATILPADEAMAALISGVLTASKRRRPCPTCRSSPRHRFPGSGVAGAAQDPGRPDAQLCRYRRRRRPTEAVRAVGTANGSNPVAVLIPCHRVIRSDGSLGGYAGGLDRKRELLEAGGRARRRCLPTPPPPPPRNCRWLNGGLPEPWSLHKVRNQSGRGLWMKRKRRAARKPLWRRIIDFPLVAMLIAVAVFVLALSASVLIGKLLPPMDKTSATSPRWRSRIGLSGPAYKLVIRHLGEHPRDDLRLAEAPQGIGRRAAVRLPAVLVGGRRRGDRRRLQHRRRGRHQRTGRRRWSGPRSCPGSWRNCCSAASCSAGSRSSAAAGSALA